MSRLIYIILLTFFASSLCEEQFCSADNTKFCKKNEIDHQKLSYTKATNEGYQKYLTVIQDAERDYKECNNTKNSCFRDVIIHDLSPFKKGISEEMIVAAKIRGTFYQIIGGKLYREKDCMFPTRCAGIEHFLLKVIDNLSDMDLIINIRDYPQSSEYFGNAMPIFSFSKHGHFGKVVQLSHYILVVLADGIDIVNS